MNLKLVGFLCIPTIGPKCFPATRPNFCPISPSDFFLFTMKIIPCSVPRRNLVAPASLLLSIFVGPYSFSTSPSVFIRKRGLSVSKSISTGWATPIEFTNASFSLISHQRTLPSVLDVTNSFEFFDFSHTKSDTGSVWEFSTFVKPTGLFVLRSKKPAVPFAHPTPRI